MPHALSPAAVSSVTRVWCPCSPTCHLSNPTGQFRVEHDISGLGSFPYPTSSCQAVSTRFEAHLGKDYGPSCPVALQVSHAQFISAWLSDMSRKVIFGLWDIDSLILKLNVAQTSFNIWLFSCNFWDFKY